VNDVVISGLTWYGALGGALIAGLFFAFSVTVMSALGQVSPATGITVMQSINRTIINPVFLLTFLGTGLVSLVLGVASLLDLGETDARYALAGSAIYLIGVIVVTSAMNVSRNVALDKLDAAAESSVPTWNAYLSEWTAWNHVRTVATLGATICFILALQA
jgi:uncharacterized membrane protein